MTKTSSQAQRALHKFKYEMASELGTNYEYKTGYWGNVAARERIAEGGTLVRRLLASAELRTARDTIAPL